MNVERRACGTLGEERRGVALARRQDVALGERGVACEPPQRLLAGQVHGGAPCRIRARREHRLPRLGRRVPAHRSLARRLCERERGELAGSALEHEQEHGGRDDCGQRGVQPPRAALGPRPHRDRQRAAHREQRRACEPDHVRRARRAECDEQPRDRGERRASLRRLAPGQAPFDGRCHEPREPRECARDAERRQHLERGRVRVRGHADPFVAP